MKKEDFLRVLANSLKSSIPQSERSDILADYEEHFRMGILDGRTEEEIASALGDPRAIGREFSAVSLLRQAEEIPSAGGIGRAIVATVGLGLINLIFVLLPALILISMIIVFLCLGVAIICTGPFLIGYGILELSGLVSTGIALSPLAGIFDGIGITCLGFLILIADYWMTKFFYRLAIRYLHWNIAVIHGKEEI